MTAMLATSQPRGTYAELLDLLPDTPLREDRATILDAMALNAARAAVLARGAVSSGSDDNPLGWHETATLLRRLAAAERGLVLTGEDQDAPGLSSLDLANATTSAEYLAALAAVAGDLEHEARNADHAAAQLAGWKDKETPRETAVRALIAVGRQDADPREIGRRRMAEAACACTSAYPDASAA
jgi:hypothetical protein